MITLKDLAKELKVSVSTVSKALNDSYEISEDTIAKVKELAKKHNYKPNKAALSLKKNKTRTIGVILPNILNPFFARSLHSIEEEASKHNYSIITCISNESLEKEKKSISLLTDGSVDGFLISVAEETQKSEEIVHLEEVLSYDIPMVMFDRSMKKIVCDKVIIDDFMAVYDATNHLIEEGRKKIVLLNALSGLNVGELRVNGYKTAITEATDYREKPIVINIAVDADVDQQLEEVFETYKDIDAVLAIDNTLGAVALNTIKNRELNIPEEISVIGFSGKNIIVFTHPKLTTISQHSEEIGRKALEVLITKIEKENYENTAHTTTIINTKLEHRETTKHNQ
ncbi:LacI family DNA-binding transcriptional regulator [Tenacibaculum amylolyticum]|uniref:LacI family DNA-binding transcriptional regulator n=1 Tax=Tenacibaculum amylolyticum TaxID=104269 RepID=UPI0038942D0B